MSLITKCDFCGKIYNPPNLFAGRYTVSYHCMGTTDYDMCINCQEKLKEFLDTLKKENKENGTGETV